MVGKMQYNTTLPTAVETVPVEPQCGSRGALLVQLMGANSANGAVVVTSPSDGAASPGTALWVQAIPVSFNGTNYDRVSKPNITSRLASSAATNNATSVKATPGNVYTLSVVNTNVAARYLKLYNKASAPAPATDNALLMWVVQVPASTVNGGYMTLDFGAQPLYFSTGIAYAMVTGASDTDNTSVGAGDLLVMNLAYS
jgi:hypothetical protein